MLPSVSVLYLLYRYGWGERLVGLTLAAVGVASIVVQGGVIGPVTRRFGERVTLMLGLGFGVAGFLVFALAENGTMFWLGIPLMALWGLEGPACLALMSRFVGPSEQGRLQGANASVSGIANMVGPIMFTQTFAVAIGSEWNFAGAPFVLAALLLFAAAIAAWLVTRGRV